MAQDRLRALPAVGRLLAHPRAERLLQQYSRGYVVQQCRGVLDDLRRALTDTPDVDDDLLSPESVLGRIEAAIGAAREPSLRRVVNATGTVLHTNLGRALLPQAAVAAVAAAAAAPLSLEYDLASGERGRREASVERLLVDLTGAEAATVVNNNAAAVLLVLNTLASGKDVIISRGEQIEIGGAFRMPDILARSGATLREVGTTNRTHAGDYEEAITPRTGLLLKVHTSNYRIVGFVAEVGLPELVAIGRRHGVPVVEDLGSGALVDLGRCGLPKEPVVRERIAMGADVVTFSGDKLLGGPQSGLVAGRASCVEQVAANPLHRALRCDKLTLAAMEATLRLYRESTDVYRDIPTLRILTRPPAEVEDVARRAAARLIDTFGAAFTVSVEESTCQVGSGALPVDELPTWIVAVEHRTMSAHGLAGWFRHASPPIIGRVRDGRFILDARTVFDAGDLVPHWHGGAPV